MATTTNGKGEVKPPRKVMDVTQPSKVVPLPSAKPIIVSNRPMLKQDPMMAPVASGSQDTETEKMVSRVAHSIKIDGQDSADETMAPDPVLENSSEAGDTVASPPSDTSAAAPTLPANSTEPEGSSPASPASPAEAAKPAPSRIPGSDNTESPPPRSDPASDDQLAPNQAIDEAKKKEEDQKAATKAAQEKIIDSKQYYLPIKDLDSRRGLQLALFIFLLVLIIAIVWLDISLDAGIVHLGNLHSVTHFFHS